jgi:hypothetical protein
MKDQSVTVVGFEKLNFQITQAAISLGKAFVSRLTL